MIRPRAATGAPRGPPLHPGDTVELAVLEVTPTDVGCRRLDDGSRLTFRGVEGVFLVPGQLAEVKVKRQWRFGRPFLSGSVTAVRVDVARLGLAPLGLTPVQFTPEGPPVSRQAFALEDRVPGRGRRRDPLAEAERAFRAGDEAGAIQRAWRLLARDLRCLGAHALLGAVVAEHPLLSASHFEVGRRIGEHALGPDFGGLLPWTFASNRAFLRCLAGHAAGLARAGRRAASRTALERLRELAPDAPPDVGALRRPV